MKNCVFIPSVPTALVAAVASVLWAPFAFGQPVFGDDFESYPDDAALTSVWQRVYGTVASIHLAQDPVNPGSQAIQETTVAARLRRIFAGAIPADGAPLTFSFDLYDTTGSTGGRVFAEIRSSADATGLLAAGIYTSVNIGTYDITRYQARSVDSGGWIQLAAPRSVGWHNFRFKIAGSTVSLYVDNVLDPNFTARTYSGNVTYNWVHLGSALSSGVGCYFDNVSVAVSPTPLAPTLTGLARSGNQFSFTLTGTAGARYVIESAPQLPCTNWTAIVTGAAPFMVIEPATISQRFYRAKAGD